jgi:hypothetical protein
MTASHGTSSGDARLGVPPLPHLSGPAWRAGEPAAPKMTRRRQLAWQIAGVAALVAFSLVVSLMMSHRSSVLLAPSFPKAEMLITNERAYFDPNAPGVRTSQDWQVTSGSLFSYEGAGWTGVPDGVRPDATSRNGTDSAVFRAVTRRADFTNVTVSFQLKVAELVTTQRTPAGAYDGVHVFLRYQNYQSLYAVSVYRRDGIVAVKEKLPGGPSDGGTYYTLAEAPYRIPLHTWVPIRVTIVTLTSKAIRISLIIRNRQILTTTEPASRVPPILSAGRVGLRGDNCEFYFRDFTVSPATP